MADNKTTQLPDIDLGKLNIREDDKVARKLLMLVEGTFGIGVGKALEKYGYTEPRFYQLKKEFLENGSDALADRKRGPKTNSVRKENVDMLIIRMKFRDPDCSARVIAQKLNQSGTKISLRSVERTITQYGLQKKTSSG